METCAVGVNHEWGVGAQRCFQDGRGQGANTLAFVRIVKPLRIVKMSRVLKLFVRFR
jgi:hypothetical protein